jgi:hypothetical protein
MGMNMISNIRGVTSSYLSDNSLSDRSKQVQSGSPSEPEKESPGTTPLAPETSSSQTEELSADDVRLIAYLKARDIEVRAHEQAHLAVAGGYARSGASYQYTQGPDGKRYAVGGEVQIDTSKEDEPRKTITKAQVVRRAALAPANPSPQDRAVAAAASQMELVALRELAQLQSLQTGVGKQIDVRG